MSFQKLLLVCMLISEFTIIGLLGLKKAKVATPLMIRKYLYSIRVNLLSVTVAPIATTPHTLPPPSLLSLSTALIVITILFSSYVRQQHFRCTEVLPLNKCVEVDRKRQDERRNFDFVRGEYIQEELREKQAFPDDLSQERAESLGLVRPSTEDFEKVSLAADTSRYPDEKETVPLIESPGANIDGGLESGSAEVEA